MALNIGSLVGYLELDDRNFTRKAEQAEKKIVGLKGSLAALAASDPKLKLRVDAETAKLDEIHARLTELKAQAARGIDVRVDTAKAMAELQALDARIRSMPDVEIKTDRAVKDVRALGVAIAVLAPTIGTVTASTAGMTVAVGGVFAAAAGGIGLWAKVAQSAVKDTLKQQKALDAAKKKADEATDPKKKAQALADYQVLLDGMSKRQQRFIENNGKMKDAWSKLTGSKAVFGPVNSGLALLATILPKLKPLLDTVSKSLTTSLDGVESWVKGGSFDKFIAGWSKLAGPGITSGLKTLGNIAKGFGGMAQAFGPLGLQMFAGMERASASFAKWGNNSAGLQEFVAYVSANGPKLVHLLGDLTEALVHIGMATAPMGNVILTVLSGIAKGVSMIPVPLLVPLASGLVAVNLALKALAVTTAAANALGMERAAAALGGMSRMKFAGVAAGVGAIAASASSGSKALSILGSAAGGALIGFQVGGPWGAAIGAGAGALFGLVTASHKSAKALDDEVPSADALASSLRGVAGAATDAARAQEILAARKNGSLKTGTAIGLTPRQIADASLGNGAAQAAAARAVAAQRARLQADFDAAKAEFGRLGSMPVMDRPNDFAKQMMAAQDAVRNASKAYRDGGKALDEFQGHLGAAATQTRSTREQIWLTQQITTAYAKNLKKLPQAVQTKVQALDVAPTLGDIARIARAYHLTPKQIETLLKATGIDRALADVQRVITRQNQIDRNIPVTVSFSVIGMEAVHAAQTQANAMSRVNATVGPRKANGGRISGRGSGTSDSIVANVSNGEFIVNARATKRNLPLLTAINAGSFAKGGQVGKRKAAARAHDQKLLDAYMASLAATNTKIGDAQSFGGAFAGNAFAQGFTGASGAMSTPTVLNGSMVSTSTGASNAGILDQMFAYQASQYAQAKTLNDDINRLRKLGVSKTLIEQMQSAGAAGVSQIHALAGGSAAQVKAFNSKAVQTQSLLNNAGAVGTTGASYSSLQADKKNEQTLIKGIREALKHGVKVEVVHGHVRPV